MSESSGKLSRNKHIYNVPKTPFLRVTTQALCIVTLFCVAPCYTLGGRGAQEGLLSALGRAALPPTCHLNCFELMVLGKQQMQQGHSHRPFSSCKQGDSPM